MTRKWNAIMLLVTFGAAGILGAANLHYGALNQDEGWYLYAARLVSHGLQPYRDFAFTQAPVMPFVYAMAYPLVESFGVAGGRFFTALLGFVAALLAAALAGRLVPRESRNTAVLVAAALIMVNVYQSYFFTVVKTYALCSLFLSGGLLLLVIALEKKSAALCFVSSLLMTLAAGTRISAGAGVAVAFVYLFFQRDTIKAGWLAFAGGAALAAVPVFLRWHLTAPEGFLFGVFEYHAARSAGGLMQALVYKAGFISRVVQGYFVAIALGLALIVWQLLRGRISTPDRRKPSILVWAVVAAISLVHFAAPFPYDDYQALVFPLFAAVLAAALVRRVVAPSPESGFASQWLVLTVFGLCVAAAFSSPINQSWFVRGQDRMWWRLREKPALAQLQETGKWIRENTKPGARILTQDLYLAVEADRNVMPGLEMGPFSYFPDMEQGRSRRLHVLNRNRMANLILSSRAPIAALSGYSFAVASPRIEETSIEDQSDFYRRLTAHYELLPDQTILYFGQGETTLQLYKRKKR